MAKSKTYSSVTREALNCLKKDLQAKGVTPPAGDSGVIEQMGVKVSVNYTETSHELQVTITDKPIFVPEDMIWGMLDSAVLKCAGGGH